MLTFVGLVKSSSKFHGISRKFGGISAKRVYRVPLGRPPLVWSQRLSLGFPCLHQVDPSTRVLQATGRLLARRHARVTLQCVEAVCTRRRHPTCYASIHLRGARAEAKSRTKSHRTIDRSSLRLLTSLHTYQAPHASNHDTIRLASSIQDREQLRRGGHDNNWPIPWAANGPSENHPRHSTEGQSPRATGR